MTTIGRGPLPNPATMNPSITDRWLVPKTDKQPRKYYKLISGVWVFQPPKSSHDYSDPVVLENGTVTTFGKMAEHLTTDYSAIVSANL